MTSAKEVYKYLSDKYKHSFIQSKKLSDEDENKRLRPITDQTAEGAASAELITKETESLTDVIVKTKSNEDR